MNVIDNINQFFVERHIHLKQDWLKSAVEYSRAQTGLGDVHPTVVYELWKYADIRESTNPCITESIMNTSEFNGTMVLQIQAITDIGTSYLSQFKKLVYVVTDNAEFQSFDTPDNSEKEKEVGSRLLQLLLSDGVRQIKAVEYKRVDQLSLLVCPGSKMIIHGSVRVRREVFLLKPENCQLLGGDVEALMRTNRPVEIMASKLHLPIPPRPAINANCIASANPSANQSAVSSAGDNQSGNVNGNLALRPPTNSRPDLVTRMNAAAAVERIAAEIAPTHAAERSAVDVSTSSSAAFAARLMSMPPPKRASQWPTNVSTTTSDASHGTPLVSETRSSAFDDIIECEPPTQQVNVATRVNDAERQTSNGVVDLSDFEYERITPTRKRSAATASHGFFASPPRKQEAGANDFTFPTQTMNGFDHTPLAVTVPPSQSQRPTPATQTPRPVEVASTTPATTPSAPVKDAEAHFGEYVASLLRVMSSEKRSEKRAKIFAVLNAD